MSFEQNRVLQYAAAEFFYEGQDVRGLASLFLRARLIPKSEESFNHTARRNARVGPDNKLYIQIGQPYNVPTKEKGGSLQESRHGRHHPHGSGRQEPRDLFDRSAQSRGLGLQPEGTKTSVEQRQTRFDGMGDDISTPAR